MEDLCHNLLAVSHGNIRLPEGQSFGALRRSECLQPNGGRLPPRLYDSHSIALFDRQGLNWTLCEDYPRVQ